MCVGFVILQVVILFVIRSAGNLLQGKERSND
jgi:hypothetical protein